MTPEFINHTSVPIPKRYLTNFLGNSVALLKRSKHWPPSFKGRSLQMVFLSKPKARNLNMQFRGKNYATDVLSFESMDPLSLGELVFCPKVLQKQAKQHKLSYRDELCYMALHGMLHLMGFDHETSKKDAERMYSLQDRVFDRALKKM